MKEHMYIFSFIDSNDEGPDFQYATAYRGYPERDMITRGRIAEARVAAGVKPASVLLNCSYLGYMTEAELNN